MEAKWRQKPDLTFHKTPDVENELLDEIELRMRKKGHFALRRRNVLRGVRNIYDAVKNRPMEFLV